MHEHQIEKSRQIITKFEYGVSRLEQALADAQNAKDALLTERAQFDLFTDAIPDHALVALDADGRVLRWNRGAERLLGWCAREILGQPCTVFYTPEDIAKDAARQELKAAAREGYIEEERWHIRRDGSRFWGSGSLSAVRHQAGDLVGFTKVMRDTTRQREAEKFLRESEERLRLFIENVTDYALLQVDSEARICAWNAGAARTFGFAEEEILGAPLKILELPEHAATGDVERDLELARERGRFEDERWLVRKDGSRLFCRWVTTPMWDEAGKLRGYAKVLRDETQRRRDEERIRGSLTEKQALLQEIHHRVKNNLQVITSLLSIQAARIDNPQLSAVLADTQHRVRAIAALHETLYSSEDLGNVEFGSYLEQLVGDLTSFYHQDKSSLEVNVETTDLVLDIKQAIPLGLILNELVTNAFKHAFPSGRTGHLDVQLGYSQADPDNGQIPDDGFGHLTIKDDGVGLPPNRNFEESPSMGLHLVTLLVEQLRGELEVDAQAGTKITIKFPVGGSLIVAD